MQQFIDKLIDGINEEIKETEYMHSLYYDERIARKNALQDVIEFVNQLAEEYKGGWIPCEVRLPNKEESTDVYVTYMDSRTKERFVDVECYFHGVWVKSLKWYESRVAWMPLPEPYQKEGE